MPRPPVQAGSVTLRFERPLLMGVLNVTPDSFSDGGRLGTVAAALARAEELVAAGADILDVGGESTRPGSMGVDAHTEAQRVLPVIEALSARRLPAVISVDTSKAEVARAALERGAAIVNDVTALADPKMPLVLAEHGAAAILMHMRGEPRSMQRGEILYDDLLGDIRAHLSRAIERAVRAGCDEQRLLVDPGIGFGKTAAHNLSLTRRLSELAVLGRPIVYGPSRKRFLGVVTGREVDDRDRATAAACAIAVLAGADVLRVHDVAAARDAVLLAAAVREAP